jgi:nucleoside-diphosphate-sugar epimerase
MKYNILITGGAGNIGGSLSRELVKKGHNIIILDNLSTGNKKKLPSKNFLNWRFIKCDLNQINLSKLFKSKKIDYIFHYAAVVGVKRTLKNPNLVLNDIKGIENILNFAVKKRVKRIFYASSSEIYGEPVTIPQDEFTTPLNSRLPYAIVKNVGEAYFRSYKKTYNIDYTIFRFFNTYGPLQSDEFVITKFIDKALKNKNLIINGDGKQTRTFLYIDDNIFLTTSIFKNKKFVNDVVNIGNDNEITIENLAKKIKKILNSKSKIIYGKPLKDGDMKRRKPSLKRINIIKKQKFVNLERGILKTAKFLQNIK